ncbi:MAG: hypothetical protein M1828_006630 [Chrysothrix sp. TS-e1954]|nr:MAG: hypothetical protein M1828_006630 [Chrysothrix sp. TS-e1954]
MHSVLHHSPSPRKAAAQFEVLDDMQDPVFGGSQSTNSANKGNGQVSGGVVMPLTTSKLANRASTLGQRATTSKGQKALDSSMSDDTSSAELGMSKLSLQNAEDSKPVINEKSEHDNESPEGDSKDRFIKEKPTVSENHPATDPETARLKHELETAQQRIACMDRELSQSRITNRSLELVLGPQSETIDGLKDVTGQLLNQVHHVQGRHTTTAQSDVFSNRSAAQSPQPYENLAGSWPDSEVLPYLNASFDDRRHHLSSNWQPHLGNGPGPGFSSRSQHASQAHRPSNLRLDTSESTGSSFSGPASAGQDQGYRRHFNPSSRTGSAMGPSYAGWGSYPSSLATSSAFSPPITPMSSWPVSCGPGNQPYQPRPIGTPLSPTAMEFNAGSSLLDNCAPPNVQPWNTQSLPPVQTHSNYMPPMEPMNYRRLLDRNMNCNWRYIVDKIVCSNDQQASIFLQQKLKVSTPEQKYELIEAIIAQAYPLMINRFGNFLIQRCFEHGTPQQVIAIANAIRGNTLNLSMDAFGCHVVQKAFDVVPEDYKAIMVHELLRRIPETVIHRYACHVWQKLFELRWSDSPPQIMKYVNEALQGMWHEVALGETGSLVVQNIFENCLEEDKRPCIEEVLGSIDIVSHGQFGNWCIQHICEHGAPADKSRAIEHVLRFATEYSTDQFASKVVEKCLKVGGGDFLERYLDKVCEGRPDRPRMPLIDIAGDQYGNYLVQFILMNADPQHRELVAQHVRKHMVSLRGSKFGSRVAMLCCNPAFATRPGPPSAMPVNDRFFGGNHSAMSRGMSASGPRY